MRNVGLLHKLFTPFLHASSWKKLKLIQNLFKTYSKLILSHYYFEISKIVVNFAVLMAILSFAIGNYILESVFALSITKKSDSFILTIGRGTTLILV